MNVSPAVRAAVLMVSLAAGTAPGAEATAGAGVVPLSYEAVIALYWRSDAPAAAQSIMTFLSATTNGLEAKRARYLLDTLLRTKLDAPQRATLVQSHPPLRAFFAAADALASTNGAAGWTHALDFIIACPSPPLKPLGFRLLTGLPLPAGLVEKYPDGFDLLLDDLEADASVEGRELLTVIGPRLADAYRAKGHLARQAALLERLFRLTRSGEYLAPLLQAYAALADPAAEAAFVASELGRPATAAETAVQLADAFEKAGRFESAEPVLDQALAAMPEPPPPLVLAAVRRAMSRGDTDLALRRLALVRPETPESSQLRATVEALRREPYERREVIRLPDVRALRVDRNQRLCGLYGRDHRARFFRLAGATIDPPAAPVDGVPGLGNTEAGRLPLITVSDGAFYAGRHRLADGPVGLYFRQGLDVDQSVSHMDVDTEDNVFAWSDRSGLYAVNAVTKERLLGGVPVTGLQPPVRGLAVFSNVLVLAESTRLRIVARDGQLKPDLAPARRFRNIVDLDRGPDETLYVSDDEDRRIVILRLNGQEVGSLVHLSPAITAVDSAGVVWRLLLLGIPFSILSLLS